MRLEVVEGGEMEDRLDGRLCTKVEEIGCVGCDQWITYVDGRNQLWMRDYIENSME